MVAPFGVYKYLESKISLLKIHVKSHLDILLLEPNLQVPIIRLATYAGRSLVEGHMGTAATLIVRHRVPDYGAWRAVYETLGGLRQRHGLAAPWSCRPRIEIAVEA